MRGVIERDTRARRLENRIGLLHIVIAGTLAIAAGGLIPLASQYATELDESVLPGLALLIAVLAAILASPRLARRDWFHPLAFPALYVVVALLIPPAYIVALGRPLGSVDSGDVSPLLIGAFILTVACFSLGAAGGLATSGKQEPSTGDLDYRRIRRWGRAVLLLAVPIRAMRVALSFGSPYGAGTVDFGLQGNLETISAFLFFAGTVLVAIGTTQSEGRVAHRVDWVLIGVFAGLTLMSGSRGELVAPALFLLYAHHQYVRRIPWRTMLIATLAVAILFQGVAGTRAGSGFLPPPDEVADRVLISLGTHTQVFSLLEDKVPDLVPFRNGGTYLAAVERQLPGAVSVYLFGPPSDTGSFVLRDIVRFYDPNAGFGFSLSAEAYLNFGLVGVAIAALSVGWLFGWAYRKGSNRPTRALNILYPVLLSSLPLGLRSDALGQVKGMIYPMVVVAFVFALARARPAGAPTTPQPNASTLRP